MPTPEQSDAIAAETAREYIQFEGWTIGYETDKGDEGVIMLHAEAWPDLNGGEPTFRLRVKWDGCTHLTIPGHFHFDTEEQFLALSRAVTWIRNDLCDRVGMVD